MQFIRDGVGGLRGGVKAGGQDRDGEKQGDFFHLILKVSCTIPFIGVQCNRHSTPSGQDRSI
jgi:hypothetical protein